MHLNTIRKLLNIPEFKVIKIISATDKEIHVQLEVYKNKRFICSNCGQTHKAGYHSRKGIILEDLSISGRRVFIHLYKRRYFCPEDLRIYTEDIPWLKLGRRVTKRFAEYVNKLTAITTNKEAGWFLGIDDEKVYRIDKEILEEKAEEKLKVLSCLGW